MRLFYYNEKRREIEKLEFTHNPLLYKKIKDMEPKNVTEMYRQLKMTTSCSKQRRFWKDGLCMWKNCITITEMIPAPTYPHRKCALYGKKM